MIRSWLDFSFFVSQQHELMKRRRSIQLDDTQNKIMKIERCLVPKQEDAHIPSYLDFANNVDSAQV